MKTLLIMECAICFENFEGSNICITPCGHKFCFNCMMKSLNNKNNCPCCRAVLREDDDNSSVESDMSSDMSSDISDSPSYEGYIENSLDTITNISNINNCYATPKVICDMFIEKGYNMEDLIILCTWRVDRMNSKYNQRYLKKLLYDANDIVEKLDKEQFKREEENNLMSQEDKKTDHVYELASLFSE